MSAFKNIKQTQPELHFSFFAMNFNQLVCQWLSVSSASNRKCSSSHELWSCLTTRKSPNSFCLLFDQSIYCFIISNLTNVFLWNALFAFIEINVTGFGILLSNAVIFWHVYTWSTVSKHCFKELLQIAANQSNTIQKLIFGKKRWAFLEMDDVNMLYSEDEFVMWDIRASSHRLESKLPLSFPVHYALRN